MAERTTYGPEVETEELAGAKKVTMIVYLLQAVGLFVIITYIAAVIVNYVKLSDVKGTWLESHFRWQIRTFWYSLLWAAIGGITMPILIGFPIVFAAAIWVIYRIVKGWLYLRDGKEMYRLSV